MAQFTMKQLLLLAGVLLFLLGTGYNIYGWNTSGKTDPNLQLFGLFLMLLSIVLKKKDVEG